MDREGLNKMLGTLNRSKVKSNLHSRNQMMGRVQRSEDNRYNMEIEKEKEKVFENLRRLDESEKPKPSNGFLGFESFQEPFQEPILEDINIPKRKRIFFRD